MIRKLDNNIIEIWQIDFSKYMFTNYNCYSHVLSSEEKENASSFKIDYQRKSYILSRVILRFLLSKYTGISPELIKIYKNEYAKPFIKSSGPIKFNISHSKDKLAIAIASSEVGIDIEYINPSFDIHEVMNMTLSENEKLNIKKLEPDLQKKKFYSYWTQKEALLKAIGTGINMDLNKLEIHNNKFSNRGKEWFISPINCD